MILGVLQFIEFREWLNERYWGEITREFQCFWFEQFWIVMPFMRTGNTKKEQFMGTCVRVKILTGPLDIWFKLSELEIKIWEIMKKYMIAEIWVLNKTAWGDCEGKKRLRVKLWETLKLKRSEGEPR